MAIFVDTEHDPPRRPRSRSLYALIILAVLMTGLALVVFIPAPYVVEQPGPVFDVLGEVEVEGESVQLIDIPNEETYETDGELNMLTVTVSGNRQSPPTWYEIASAWLDPSKAVLPVDDVYPEGVTVEQSDERSRTDMLNSQREAIAAALSELGYAFSGRLTVVGFLDGGPAQAVLDSGDVIQSVNGITFEDVSALREEIARNGTSVPATVIVNRSGEELEFDITPILSEGAEAMPIIGIEVGSDYDFPVDVEIQLENVGGPSAGMMFALGIIDKLTPGAITGGEIVAGTGTIEAGGTIGRIGGIRQKLYGASQAGADWFLAPSGNCDEVVGHVPQGLSVFSVATLDDSLAVLESVSAGDGGAGLPTCEAS